MESTTLDHLLIALARNEERLTTWLNTSADNARHFRKDPIGAMIAAELKIAPELILELQSVLKGIADKFNQLETA